jgi:hypothetical protein
MYSLKKNEKFANYNVTKIISLLNRACEMYGDEEGWTNVSASGAYIKRQMPYFSSKKYGFSKLPELIENYPNLYAMKKYKGKGVVNIIAYRKKNGQTQNTITGRYGKYYGLEDILPKPAHSGNGCIYKAIPLWGWRSGCI